jgi:phosphoglycolate phosphatase
VVFDLDGTLVNSRRDLADSVNAMLAERGDSPLSEDEIGKMVGEGARVLVARALAARGSGVVDTGDALERFLQIYDGKLLDHTRAYDGVPELLKAIAARAAMAVLTNKPLDATRRILDGLGLADFFRVIVGGDGPLPRKPDPAALLDLVYRCGANPGETLLVGDSPIDLQTGHRAGVRICIAAYGFGFRFGPEELEGVPIARQPRDVLTLV